MPNSDEAVCINCKQRIVRVNYSNGPTWVHQPAGASFQDGVHIYCHVMIATAADPGEVPDARR